MALVQLPHSIPLGNSKYNFEHYAPNPERVELYASTEATLNNALKVTFAPKSRKDESALCHFEFQERGLGLVAVVDVLTAALNEFPNSALLQKWVRDLYRTVVFQHHMRFRVLPTPKIPTAAATAAPLTKSECDNVKGDSEALAGNEDAHLDAPPIVGLTIREASGRGKLAGHLNY